MAHHHHHATPSVVEGRTGIRRGAAFIVSGLSSGHGVFHWISQSFIVVLPEVRDVLLGGSNIAATSVQTTREIASGVVALPGGVLTDALRRYWGWVMAVCMALFGVGWLLMAAAGWQLPGSAWMVSQETASAGTSLNVLGYVLLLAGMAIVAIAASVWHLPAMAALSSHFTHRRASVLSFHGVGGNVGDVAGPVLTGLLLVSLTWQAIITIYAAVPIFLAFLVFWAFRDIGHRAQAAAEAQPANMMRSQIEETKILVRNPRMWGITIVAGLRGMAYLGFISVLPLYLADVLGLSSQSEHGSFENLFIRGSLIGLLVLVGILVSPIMGYLADRLGRKTILVPGMIVLGVVTLLMAPLVNGEEDLIMMTVLLALLGLFLYSDQPILTAAAMDIVREGTAATTMGLMSTSRFMFSAVSPIIAAWLYGIDPNNLFYYVAALYGLAVLILLMIRLPRPVPAPDDHHGHDGGHGHGGHDGHGHDHGGHGHQQPAHHGHDHEEHGHGSHAEHGHGEHGHGGHAEHGHEHGEHGHGEGEHGHHRH